MFSRVIFCIYLYICSSTDTNTSNWSNVKCAEWSVNMFTWQPLKILMPLIVLCPHAWNRITSALERHNHEPTLNPTRFFLVINGQVPRMNDRWWGREASCHLLFIFVVAAFQSQTCSSSLLSLLFPAGMIWTARATTSLNTWVSPSPQLFNNQSCIHGNMIQRNVYPSTTIAAWYESECHR